MKSPNSPSDAALANHAKRAARRCGMRAIRLRGCSQWRGKGGFMLIEARGSKVRYGHRFELSAEDVLEICTELENTPSSTPTGEEISNE